MIYHQFQHFKEFFILDLWEQSNQDHLFNCAVNCQWRALYSHLKVLSVPLVRFIGKKNLSKSTWWEYKQALMEVKWRKAYLNSLRLTKNSSFLVQVNGNLYGPRPGVDKL